MQAHKKDGEGYHARGRAVARLLIVLVALFFAGCHNRTPASPGNVAEFTAQMDALVPRLLQKHRVAGTSIALVHNGEVVWAQGYGLADKINGISVTLDTVFQAASISKPVSAWGVMRLVEEGKLNLDAPVERYLTRWHLPPSEFDHDGVTIRRLLSHSAGLSLHGYPGFEPGQPLPTVEESLSGATGGAGDVRVVQEPGLKFSYSGGGYTLLQLVVEEVTGETFAAYVQREILDALGMTNSNFECTSEPQPATAAAYDAHGQLLPNYLFMAKAAAGLCTTAPDLARFVAAGMTGPHGEPIGRGVLSPDTLTLMFSPVVETGVAYRLFDSEAYGLGYGVETLPSGTRLVSHGGSHRGWRSQFAALPEKGEGIIILTNSDRGSEIITDIMCAWGAWVGEGTPRRGRSFQTLRTAMFVLAAILGLGLVVRVWRLLAQIRSGRRRLGWRYAQTPVWRRVLDMVMPLLIVALWWLLVHPLLLGLSPTPSGWVTWAFTLWSLAGVIMGLAPRIEPYELNDEPS